jgi:fluoride ion exporter CrcB/FEX
MRIIIEMRTDISNVGVWVLILLALASFIPAIHFIDRQSMFEIVDGLAVGGAIGALIRWGPAAWNALWPPARNLKAYDLLAVGIALLALGGAARLGMQWYWRANDKHDSIIDSVPMVVITLVVVVGYFLTLVPTFSSDGVYLERPWKSGLLALLSLAISVLIIWAGWG